MGLRVFKHILLDWVEDFWRRGKSPWEKALMGKMSMEVSGGRGRDRGYSCHTSDVRTEFFLHNVTLGILTKTGNLINTQKHCALSGALLCLGVTHQ